VDERTSVVPFALSASIGRSFTKSEALHGGTSKRSAETSAVRAPYSSGARIVAVPRSKSSSVLSPAIEPSVVFWASNRVSSLFSTAM